MFHLFRGETYYPRGGLNDYVGSFETLEEAKAAAGDSEWAHVAQVVGGRLVQVWQGYLDPDGFGAPLVS